MTLGGPVISESSYTVTSTFCLCSTVTFWQRVRAVCGRVIDNLANSTVSSSSGCQGPWHTSSEGRRPKLKKFGDHTWHHGTLTSFLLIPDTFLFWNDGGSKTKGAERPKGQISHFLTKVKLWEEWARYLIKCLKFGIA